MISWVDTGLRMPYPEQLVDSAYALLFTNPVTAAFMTSGGPS